MTRRRYGFYLRRDINGPSTLYKTFSSREAAHTFRAAFYADPSHNLYFFSIRPLPQ